MIIWNIVFFARLPTILHLLKLFFENEEFLAFPPLEPATKGHTMVIPKKHYENIFDIDGEVLGRLMGVAKKLAPELVKQHSATGINLLQASGKDAEQSVFHFHLHLVPRHPQDGLSLWLKNKI